LQNKFILKGISGEKRGFKDEKPENMV